MGECEGEREEWVSSRVCSSRLESLPDGGTSAGRPGRRVPVRRLFGRYSGGVAGMAMRQAMAPEAVSPAMARRLLVRNGSVPFSTGAKPMPT